MASLFSLAFLCATFSLVGEGLEDLERDGEIEVLGETLGEREDEADVLVDSLEEVEAEVEGEMLCEEEVEAEVEGDVEGE